jgi:hypothetical protein
MRTSIISGIPATNGSRTNPTRGSSNTHVHPYQPSVCTTDGNSGNLELPSVTPFQVRENDASPIQAMRLRHRPVSKSSKTQLCVRHARNTRFLALDQLAAVARVGLFRRSKLAKFRFVQRAITPPSASYEHFETEVEATESSPAMLFYRSSQTLS